jgi:hypothetical protein
MRKTLLFGLCMSGLTAIAQTVEKDTLFYTGGEQTWTVPCGASNVVIDAYGAKGAAGNTINPGINSGGQAGLGNHVTGNWSSLNPNDIIYVYVGGQATGYLGGYNGGGNGVDIPTGINPSGGGGGATDIRFPSNALSDRIQVAGGGGGGGNAGYQANGFPFSGGNGGNGGGNQTLYGNSLNGANGGDCLDQYSGLSQPANAPGAGGGTTAGPGLAGAGCSGYIGVNGQPNSNNMGGNGGAGIGSYGNFAGQLRPHGGGGGGGFQGGNGGGGGSADSDQCAGNAWSGGGGGSAGTNYFDGPITGTNGVNNGDGYVVITYTLTVDSTEIDESFAVPCIGGSTLIFANNGGGGQFTVISGPSATFNDGEFTPSTEGTYVITCTDTDACGYATTDTVTINVDCTLGLNENAGLNFRVNPNPATDVIALENAENTTVSMVDVTGKVVMHFENYEGQNIQIEALNNGVYFLQIEKEGQIGTAKFVKE